MKPLVISGELHDQLFEDVTINKLNDRQLATKYNLSVSTVYDWRSRNNIESPYFLKIDKDDEFGYLYYNGLNDKSIADVCSCSVHIIQKWRSRNNLQAVGRMVEEFTETDEEILDLFFGKKVSIRDISGELNVSLPYIRDLIGKYAQVMKNKK